jgi:uncharacterized pyridoxamine 5'-phosphate oxidase family protein
MGNKMIIKDAKITVVISNDTDLAKLNKVSTKRGINIRQISAPSIGDGDPKVFEISGSFESIFEASKLFSFQEEKKWLFVREIKSRDKVAVCSSQEEFSKMISNRYYDQYEYKLEKIVNISLMAFSDDFSLQNEFTKELDEIFASDTGWKPIQKITYWE